MSMEEALFRVFLFVLGACFGSFLCCQARRLHYRTQQGKKQRGKLTNKSAPKLPNRSICPHCKYQLKWYDNIPIFSWLVLKGRCRKCHKKIGIAEFLSELLTGLAWLALGATINLTITDPLIWINFIILLVFSLVLIFLAIYDGAYGELPTKFLTVSIILAAIILLINIVSSIALNSFRPETILQPLGSVLILGGLYLVLYLVSKGKWVGDGDWLLALALGLALGQAWLALIALFLANLFACLYALPRFKQNKKIYFGPFLVAAFIITTAFANLFQSML